MFGGLGLCCFLAPCRFSSPAGVCTGRRSFPRPSFRSGPLSRGNFHADRAHRHIVGPLLISYFFFSSFLFRFFLFRLSILFLWEPTNSAEAQACLHTSRPRPSSCARERRASFSSMPSLPVRHRPYAAPRRPKDGQPVQRPRRKRGECRAARTRATRRGKATTQGKRHKLFQFSLSMRSNEYRIQEEKETRHLAASHAKHALFWVGIKRTPDADAKKKKKSRERKEDLPVPNQKKKRKTRTPGQVRKDPPMRKTYKKRKEKLQIPCLLCMHIA